jgi:alkylation response protein AidB-like acyl-CoA dehydrogenase
MNAGEAFIRESATERVRRLLPLLDEHGAEMDRRRDLTPEVVKALVDADMLRLLLPRSIGGQEIDLLEFCRVNELAASADASAAWFITQCNVSASTSAAALPHEVAAEMFGGPQTGAAWGPPHGNSRAVRVDGGYRLTGEWSFASGGRHTRWLGAHSAVQNPDGTPHMRYDRPDYRTFLFPRSEATIIDDWHVLGLRATGSDSYAVNDLFIPDHHAPLRDTPEERREAGPLYPIGSVALYACGFSSVTIGLGRRLLDSYIELTRGRSSKASSTSLARNNSVQQEIATLDARLSAARALLHEAAGAAYDASERGALELDHRMKLRLATTLAMKEATDVSLACYRAAGTVAIRANAPFERRLRDALTASQHVQGSLLLVEMVGRHLIGTDNVVMLL